MPICAPFGVAVLGLVGTFRNRVRFLALSIASIRWVVRVLVAGNALVLPYSLSHHTI